ncbi:DUF1613-domain-containing protein [Coprinopsis marcescibilis]|uniref:tRNA (uracil-O(2)-)-methyltransferase n=1 Tax=Coprinopsis marcescibilis TaxID=230819 RepID=A0A5C3L5J8_COPMA|nr:DUF1613-domain-containing protein [Coprinopsis marcescibilis]
MILSPADFPPEIFGIAVTQLIHHPEYNSTLILRSDVVAEYTSDFPGSIPKFEGLKPVLCIHRKLLPRRPGRDGGLEQYCSLYASTTTSGPGSDLHHESDSAEEPVAAPVITTLVLTPIVAPGGSLPYYHPAVSHLAFRYISSPAHPEPSIRIETLPLPGTPMDPNSRLYRTCLALLETVHRYGWGAMSNYKKRVIHDCIVPREIYQDVYLVMRERHKHLVDTWQEVTDPLKHVFEDIAIATFLILLWKDMYGSLGFEESRPLADAPWKDWPRPPGGFLDFGCGNGLLTHILVSEGYEGVGIDLRARTSWDSYPDASKRSLHVHAFNPLDLVPSTPSEYQSTSATSTSSNPSDPDSDPDSVSLPSSNPFFKPGTFIIGNHADELTPWVPVVATLTGASGYLSIPCCAWTFDSKFQRSTAVMFPLPEEDVRDGGTTPQGPTNADVGVEGKSKSRSQDKAEEQFVENLNLGGDNSSTASAYSVYRIWLARLSAWCGWKVECEVLRIPSTRNWAIVGRQRMKTVTEDDAQERVQEIIEDVRRIGAFKTRTPEGKAGKH